MVGRPDVAVVQVGDVFHDAHADARLGGVDRSIYSRGERFEQVLLHFLRDACTCVADGNVAEGMSVDDGSSQNQFHSALWLGVLEGV